LTRRAEILNDLVSYIGFLQTSEALSDASFHCSDGQVCVHRAVLGTRCSLLRSLNNDEDIELYTPDFSKHTVQLLMYLLYTGTTNVNQSDFENVNSLARILGVENSFESTRLANRKRKLIIKHENNLSSRKPVPEPKQNRKKRVFMANLDKSDLTCDVCYKTFPKLYKLKNHQLIHLNSFPFICSNCGKGFKNKYKLNSHEKEHKQGILKPERKKAEVKAGVGRKENYYPCKHCGEQFLGLSGLSNHVASNHKPQHTCIHCARNLRTKKNLIAHLRVVHNDLEGVLTHVCNVCDKRFLKPSHLEDHQARHDPIGQHPCMYCPKRCATKQDLDRHLVSHRGEAKLTCQLCFKAFVHRSTYTQHVRKHLGQKPYVCKPCNKNYSQFKSLRQHQKTHEKKGDGTILVLPTKGSRGVHSYIDVISQPVPINIAADQKQKELSTQVYIPGPQYTKSTGYKSVSNMNPLKQQVITDYTEISRIGFTFQDGDSDGFKSVELDHIFPSQTINQTILDHDLTRQ